MRKELLIIREPGEQIPADFRAKALSEYPTALGYASPQNDEDIEWKQFVSNDCLGY